MNEKELITKYREKHPRCKYCKFCEVYARTITIAKGPIATCKLKEKDIFGWLFLEDYRGVFCKNYRVSIS